MANTVVKKRIAPSGLECYIREEEITVNDHFFLCLELERDVAIIGMGLYTSSVAGVYRDLSFDFQPLQEPDDSNYLSRLAYVIDDSVSQTSLYLEQEGRVLPYGTRILWHVNPTSDDVTTSFTLVAAPA